MSKAELAHFLRERRARLRPGEADLRPRRTPGLRREEVAQRARMSVEYYTRLEQARAANPSPRILESLSAALELDGADHIRLFALASTAPAAPGTVPLVARPHLVELIDRMPDTAAIITAATYEVIAFNPLAEALLGDLGTEPNLARRYFLHGRHWSSPADDFAEVAVARLRAAATRYPSDEGLAHLLGELRDGSEVFRRVWATEPTHAPGHRIKTVDHPGAGRIQVACDVLLVPEEDQQLVLITAAPGSRDERALRSLARPGSSSGANAAATQRVLTGRAAARS